MSMVTTSPLPEMIGALDTRVKIGPFDFIIPLTQPLFNYIRRNEHCICSFKNTHDIICNIEVMRMFKIGEFSKLTQVSIRMLRYYDETGLLKPAEIDKFTNYRFYSTTQISTLNKIIFLRDLGFNVSEIAVALHQWDDEFIINQLEHKRREIEAAIQAGQDKLSKIELAKKDIRQEKIAIHCSVSIKSIPEYQVLSLRRTVPDYYAEGKLWNKMSSFADENDIPVSSNTFTIYHDTDYREKDVDIEICLAFSSLV